MTKINFLLALLLISMVGFTQIPQGFNYQAVLRDAAGGLKTQTEVSIEISIISGSVDGNNIYSEKHEATTNEFGLVNLVIGQGETTADITAINWSTDVFYMQVSVDGVVMGISQLLSVPFAMHAQTAGNVFSGEYNDLSNKPDLSGFLTEEADGSASNELQALSISNDTIFLSDGGFVKLPASSGFSGSFSELTNIPTGLSDGDDNTQLTEAEVDAFVSNNGYSTTDTTLDESEVDAMVANNGYLTSYTESDPIYSAWDKDYHDLTNKPSNVSAFTNDAGYITQDTTLDESEVDAMVANNGYLTSYTESDPIYSAWDKDYDDLTNKPTIPASLNDMNDVSTSTATSGNILVADGTDFESVSIAGDASLASNGYLTIEDNSVDGTDIALGSDAQGDIMYYNGTDWVRLPAGTSGQVLQTNGAGANPTWEDSGSGSPSVRTISSNTTLTTSDQIVIINGAYTATLPASPTTGQILYICGTDAFGKINFSPKVVRVGNRTFSGAFTFDEFAKNLLILVYDGINAWHVVN